MPIQFGEIKTATAIRDLFDQYWFNINIQPGDLIDDSILEAKLGFNAFQEGQQRVQEIDVRDAIASTVQGFADAVPGGNGADGDLVVSGTTYLQTDRVYQYNNLHVTSTGRIFPTGVGSSLRILVKGTLKVDSGGIIGFDGELGIVGANGAAGLSGFGGANGTGRASGGAGGTGGSGGVGGSGVSNGGVGGTGGSGGTGGTGGDGQTAAGDGPYAGGAGAPGAAGLVGGAAAIDTTAYAAVTDYTSVIQQTAIRGRVYGGGAGAQGGTGAVGATGNAGGGRGSYQESYCCNTNIYGNCTQTCTRTVYTDGTRGRGGTGGTGGIGGGQGGGGGQGAGAIYIEAKNIQIAGTIRARGGNGGPGGTGGNTGGQGQGGAGGLIVLKYHAGVDTGSWQVSGGLGHTAGPVGHVLKQRRS
jgi:hypothetical protein